MSVPEELPEPHVPAVPIGDWIATAPNLDDLGLDCRIAMTRALQSVYEAHGYPRTAATLGDAWLRLVEHRESRKKLRAAAEDAMYPTVDDPNPDEFADDDSSR